MNITKLYQLLLLLLLVSCSPDNAYIGEVSGIGDYTYSGEFMILDDSYIQVGEERYMNDITISPIEFTIEISNTNLVYKLYHDADIYEVDLYIKHIDCLEYNSLEYVEYERGMVRITFIEDYYKKCYLDDDIEKPVSFIIKSRKEIF